ncbi:MAG: amino acid adenylation domain-containing protein [Polyangiaceae bacterium]|nr:amino acid adenylation domain-containing protein [Polyangiaceae bacterium]
MGGSDVVTTSLEPLLSDLQALQVRVRVQGENLACEARPGVLSPELGQRIRTHKAELIALLNSRDGRPPICPRPAGTKALLSSSQQRIWYLEKLEPGTPLHTIGVEFELQGALDVRALGVALKALANRHEVLRARFPLGAEGPELLISNTPLVQLQVTDLRGVPDAVHQCEAAERAEVALPFDVQTDPLLRCRVFLLEPQRSLLVLVVHHIIWDGWSQNVFERELLALYAAEVTGKPADLPELAFQFSDYAAWQRLYPSGTDLESDLAYWKGVLAPPLPSLELRSDFPRPAVLSSAGDVVTLELPNALLQQFEALARAERASLFMTLLAGYVALLARSTGDSEIVVGIPVANRSPEETEPLIGMFVNTLPLRLRLDPEWAFKALLRHVRDVCLEAFEHQEVPFEKLVEAVAPARDLRRTPIFQTMFSFEDAGEQAYRPEAPLSVSERRSISAGVSRTDASVWLSRNSRGLSVAFEYATDLFERGTIVELGQRYVRLLSALIQNPDHRVAATAWLAPADREQLLRRHHGPVVALPQIGGFHELFESQAQRAPARIAVSFEGAYLSYGGLEQRANDLAQHLIQRGAGRGCLVGVAVPRSLDLLVTLLAILKTGAGYLPLSPQDPSERLSYIVQDAAPVGVVTTQSVQQRLPALPGWLVCLDEGYTALQSDSNSVPDLTRSLDDTAYVIYTSGSTGKPKGVRVQHRNVVNFLGSMARRPGLKADDVLAAVTTLSFDIAVLELFLPLTVGARVELVSEEVGRDGAALGRQLGLSGATLLQATPATWRLLLAAEWQPPPNFRALSGGEPFPLDLLEPLLKRCSEVWNMYGPTETTVWSTCARLSATSPITLGEPIDNTTLYVLDPEFQPVPYGVPGELFIAGAGVAAGYLHREELSRQRFVADPFSSEPGARMYRTGDRVWQERDGALRFGGRFDQQVKIRGFRIELAEIESVLSEHPAIKNCLVNVWQPQAGDARLVAYITCHERPPTVTDLRAHLRRQLPDYMVVQHVVVLDQLPLTPSGKLDRMALPPPTAVAAPNDAGSIAPRTIQERYLAAIWREILGIEDVSIGDNFFDRGGHSLLSIQVIARIRHDKGVELSPALFLLNSLGHIASQLPAGQNGT